jgi:hypothetical protein
MDERIFVIPDPRPVPDWDPAERGGISLIWLIRDFFEERRPGWGQNRYLEVMVDADQEILSPEKDAFLVFLGGENGGFADGEGPRRFRRLAFRETHEAGSEKIDSQGFAVFGKGGDGAFLEMGHRAEPFSESEEDEAAMEG